MTAPSPSATNGKTVNEMTIEELRERDLKNRIQELRENHGATAQDAADHSLDQPGRLYGWTQRYIERAAGVGFGKLINPGVTYGPYRTKLDGSQCWLLKVTFHVAGDNKEHCAIVYVTQQIGRNHVISCKIDF
jgi:hypothetical protein